MKSAKKSKFLKKFLVGFGVFVLILIGLIVAIPFLFKDEIKQLAVDEINKQLTATVYIGDFDVSIIKDFPSLTFTMEDVRVVNGGVFEGDTLANVPEFGLNMNLMAAIGGNYEVESVYLNGPRIYAVILPDGTSNMDIVKEEETEAAPEEEASSDEGFQFKLEDYQINNANIIYDDQQGGTYAKLVNFSHGGSGAFTENIYDLITKTTCEELTVKSGGVAYIYKSALDFDMTLNIDNEAQKYTFKDNNLALNALNLGFDGTVQFLENDAMDLDLKFSSKETAFKSLLSMLPAAYTADFADVDADGALALDGTVKGKLEGESYPAFNLNLTVDEGSFKYPDLPTGVKDIFIDAHIDNPGGDLDNTVIDIPMFNMVLGESPINAMLNVKYPMSDPELDMAAKGNVDLGKIGDLYPLAEGESLAGNLDIDMAAQGRVSAAEAEQYNDFKASGNLNIADLKYEGPDLIKPFELNTLDMQFTPTYVKVNKLIGKTGDSDFAANGRFDNLLNYVLTDAPLKGSLNLVSNNLVLEDFIGEEEESDGTGSAAKAEGSTNEMAAPEVAEASANAVPDNLDLTLQSTFKKLSYDNINMTNVRGKVTIANEVVDLDYLKAELLGGTAVIDGDYSTVGGGEPKVNLSYDVQNLSIVESVSTFGSIKQVAPIAKFLDGKFSSKMKLNGDLSEELEMIMPSLLADGVIELHNVSLSNHKVLNTLADKFKVEKLRELKIPHALTVIEIVDGGIYIEPFDINTNDFTMNLGGSHGLDNQMNYVLLADMPSKLVNGADDLFKGLLAKAPAIPGLDANVVPSELKLKADITGAVSDPKIKIGLAAGGGQGVVGNVKDQLTNKAKEEADKAKQRLEEERAKREAEAKAKLEAEKKKLEEQAKAEAEKAKQKAQEEADKAKDKVKDELKNKFKGFGK